MTTQSKKLSFIVLCLFLFGCVQTQNISLPLKQNSEGTFLTIKLGSSQCELDVIPYLGYCNYNFIALRKAQYPQLCGSTYKYNLSNQVEYLATLKLSSTSVSDFEFSVPENVSNNTRMLCMGLIFEQYRVNFLEELNDKNIIENRRVFFNLNRLDKENGKGAADFGKPDESVYSGNELVHLKVNPGQGTYSAASNRELTIFGQQLDSRSTIYISVLDPFTYITNFAFDSILELFAAKGIAFTQSSENYDVTLNSIVGLEALHFSAIQNDGSTYEIVVQPSQYTRQLLNGKYQLLLVPQFYTGSVQIGNKILDTYYIGFDQSDASILIAKKSKFVSEFEEASY